MKSLGRELKKSTGHLNKTIRPLILQRPFVVRKITLKITLRITKITLKWQFTGLVSETKPVSWPRWDSQKLDLYINEEGMIELLVRRQRLLAKELAEYMGIEIIGHKYVRKAAGIIYTIQKAFEGISMKRKFSIGSYRIDLYLPEHRLAIECDEHDHKDRNINHKIKRKLNCKFIRYNLDPKDFTTESVLNKIFQYIYLGRSS